MHSTNSVSKKFYLKSMNFSQVYSKALKRGYDFRFDASHSVKPILDQTEI